MGHLSPENAVKLEDDLRKTISQNPRGEWDLKQLAVKYNVSQPAISYWVRKRMKHKREETWNGAARLSREQVNMLYSDLRDNLLLPKKQQGFRILAAKYMITEPAVCYWAKKFKAENPVIKRVFRRTQRNLKDTSAQVLAEMREGI